MNCPNCDAVLISGVAKEDHVYYIAGQEVHFRAYIENGVCPDCHAICESPNAYEKRKFAMQQAIHEFWLKRLEKIRVNPYYVESLLKIMGELINDGEFKHKRRASEELGLWLAQQHFT